MIQDMEKFPPLERPEPRIVGPASEEKKGEYKKMISERFGEGHYDQLPEEGRKRLETFEHAKEPYEKRAIEEANRITDMLMQEAGLKPFDVPERNIHIVPDELYKEVDEEDHVGCTFHTYQLIVLNSNKLRHPFQKVATILHEIAHLKGHLALEAHNDSYAVYRSGLKVNSTLKKEERSGVFSMFHGLNEAVVLQIEKDYLDQVLASNELLKDQYEWQHSEEAEKIKEEVVKKTNKPEDEFLFVGKDEKGDHPFAYSAGYDYRKVLNYIVDTIYADNGQKFKSREEAMKLFFNAHFTGHLLTIAKFIEKSFGKESFRVIGMMDDDKNSANMTMNYLIKHSKKL